MKPNTSVIHVIAANNETADSIIMREFTDNGFTFIDGCGHILFGFDGDLNAVIAAIDTFVDNVADSVADCFVDTYSAV